MKCSTDGNARYTTALSFFIMMWQLHVSHSGPMYICTDQHRISDDLSYNKLFMVSYKFPFRQEKAEIMLERESFGGPNSLSLSHTVIKLYVIAKYLTEGHRCTSYVRNTLHNITENNNHDTCLQLKLGLFSHCLHTKVRHLSSLKGIIQHFVKYLYFFCLAKN